MKPVVSTREYAAIAPFYDRFWGGHARIWARARRRVLGSILKDARVVCDLGCGTGATAVELARRGREVFAVDLSPDMCRLTKQNARRAGVRLRVLRRDMRSFRLPRPVDLVLSEFHVINHVPRRDDLRRVFRQAAQALRPGGWFCFDASNRRMFGASWCQFRLFDSPDLFLLKEGGNDPRWGQGWLELNWFARRGNVWQRGRGRIVEFYWSEAEIRRTLRKAGFTKIQSRDFCEFLPAAKRAQSRGVLTFYLACKADLK